MITETLSQILHIKKPLFCIKNKQTIHYFLKNKS